MKRPVQVLWVLIALVAVLLVALAGPPFVRVGSCVAAYSSGERAAAHVLSTHDDGVSVRIEGYDVGQARTCFVPRGDLGRDELAAGDPLAVVIHADLPERCTTQVTLDASEALMLAMTATFVAFLLGLLLFGLVVQRSLTAAPVLTTHLDLEAKPLACPRCGKPMDEGYLPLVAGVHWRKPGEPTGLPHALGGLPGTVGWRGRPRLHGFRCETCEVVLFRYGKVR